MLRVFVSHCGRVPAARAGSAGILAPTVEKAIDILVPGGTSASVGFCALPYRDTARKTNFTEFVIPTTNVGPRFAGDLVMIEVDQYSEGTRIGDCVVIDHFATTDHCADLLAGVNDYRSRHSLPIIERTNGELPLKYSVIDGDRIAEGLRDVLNVYERVTRLVKELWHGEIEPLPDRKVACNINITQPGGSYRYHYDRNAVTAILYLNASSGGETECYPNYRVSLTSRAHSNLQHKLDRVLQNRFVRFVAATRLLVRPRPGRLLIMQGNRCLHSVRPVIRGVDRINIVMSYDRPHARFHVDDNLNRYLYSAVETHAGDPNYLP